MKPIIMDHSKRLTELVSDDTCLYVMDDCISAKASETANGNFTLEIKLPTKSESMKYVVLGGIVKVKANPFQSLQLFRIRKATQTGTDTKIYAEHITEDLKRCTVMPFRAAGSLQACQRIKENTIGADEFSFVEEIDSSSSFSNTVPQPLMALCKGQDGSLLDVYGGDLIRDNLTLTQGHRGSDNGYTIAYGKGVKNIEQDSIIDNMYTDVMPYAVKDDVTTTGTLRTIIESNHRRILNLDLSSYFGMDDAITAEAVNEKAEAYIRSHRLDKPEVSIEVTTASMDEGAELLSLCDTVHVVFPSLRIDTTAKVTEYEYNVLTEQYEKINIGRVRASLGSVMSVVIGKKYDEELAKTSEAAETAQAMSSFVANGFGLFMTRRTDEDGTVRTYMHNKQTIEESTEIYTVINGVMSVSVDGGNTWEPTVDKDGNSVLNVLSSGTAKMNVLSVLADEIKAAKYTGQSVGVDSVTTATATADNATVKQASAENIEAKTLTADSGTVKQLKATTAEADTSETGSENSKRYNLKKPGGTVCATISFSTFSYDNDGNNVSGVVFNTNNFPAYLIFADMYMSARNLKMRTTGTAEVITRGNMHAVLGDLGSNGIYIDAGSGALDIGVKTGVDTSNELIKLQDNGESIAVRNRGTLGRAVIDSTEGNEPLSLSYDGENMIVKVGDTVVGQINLTTTQEGS